MSIYDLAFAVGRDKGITARKQENRDRQFTAGQADKDREIKLKSMLQSENQAKLDRDLQREGMSQSEKQAALDRALKEKSLSQDASEAEKNRKKSASEFLQSIELEKEGMASSENQAELERKHAMEKIILDSKQRIAEMQAEALTRAKENQINRGWEQQLMDLQRTWSVDDAKRARENQIEDLNFQAQNALDQIRLNARVESELRDINTSFSPEGSTPNRDYRFSPWMSNSGPSGNNATLPPVAYGRPS